MTRELGRGFLCRPFGTRIGSGGSARSRCCDAFPAFPCRALVVPSLRDSDFTFGRPDPGLTSWAIFSRPSGLGSVDAHDFYELPAAWVRRWLSGREKALATPSFCCHDLHCSDRPV